MQERGRSSPSRGRARRRAAEWRALAGAALAGAALAGPAAAQGAVGGGTVTLLPSMGQVGPCDATAPTRDAATAEGRRRLETAAVAMSRQRVMVGIEPSGEPGEPTRVMLRRPAGWLGVNTVDVSDLRITRAGRVVRYCAYPIVVSVEPNSPAEKAGLASGDTILAYAGRDLLKSGEIELDRLLVPGQTLRVTVRRDGRTLEKPLVVGQRPTYTFFRSYPVDGEVRVYTEQRTGGQTIVTERVMGERLELPRAPRPPRPYGTVTPAVAPAAPPAPGAPLPPTPPVPYIIGYGGPSVVVGAQVVAADDDLREALRADARGVLVVRVLPGTPAAAAGLKGGDVIVRAGGEPVLTPTALHRMVLRVGDARALSLRVDRSGKEKDVTLRW
ncbi:MAG: PDZ domain-containing protein [Gemmatirosa sp.]